MSRLFWQLVAPPFILTAILPLASKTVYAQTVWSGYTLTFSKPAFSNHLLPENQDRITDSVWLTRGASQGLVNAVSECSASACSFTHSFSPEGTEWATDLIEENLGEDIEAANWQQLAFSNWEAAYGFSVGANILDHAAVLHLIEDDIYIDIRFTEWGSTPDSGTPFTYERGEPPIVVENDGDYNNDGVVDVADYVMWQKTLNEPALPSGSGADGDGDGMIDQDDYDHWFERFGTVPAGGGSAAAPEPATGVLIAFALSYLATCCYLARPSRRAFSCAAR